MIGGEPQGGGRFPVPFGKWTPGIGSEFDPGHTDSPFRLWLQGRQGSWLVSFLYEGRQ